MADRQDIDALLVSALYGELTPADEARLTMHLESHPADRTALAGMTEARTAIRESRIFAVQLEPPQSVSALLLQEAARRAPRVKAEASEGWFYRFVRSFMAHPAMAAAAMLVIVVGVAGTMYMRNGDQYAASEAPARASLAQEQAPVPVAVAATPAPMTGGEGQGKDGDKNQAAVAQGSAYHVDLDENTKAPADPAKPADRFSADTKVPAHASGELAYRPDERAPAKKKMPPSNYMELRKGEPAPAPKDLPEQEKKMVDGLADESAPGGAGPAKRGAKLEAQTAAVPKAPMPAPAASTPSPGVGRSSASPPPPPTSTIATDKTVAPKADRGGEDNSLIAWSTAQKERVLVQVRAGNCSDAASIATEIERRAPDWFAANVATDIEFKRCLSYMHLSRDQESERHPSKRAAPAPDSRK